MGLYMKSISVIEDNSMARWGNHLDEGNSLCPFHVSLCPSVPLSLCPFVPCHEFWGVLKKASFAKLMHVTWVSISKCLANSETYLFSLSLCPGPVRRCGRTTPVEAAFCICPFAPLSVPPRPLPLNHPRGEIWSTCKIYLSSISK